MVALISTFPVIPLKYASTVVWEARDPTTGELVDGVVINDPVLYGLPVGSTAQPGPGLTTVAPSWLPIPVPGLEPPVTQ